MNPIDCHLRELLDAAVGEPPRRVTVEAVRRRAARRRAARAGGVSLAVVLAAGLGAILSAGAIRSGTPPAGSTNQHAGPPRYYVAQDWDQKARKFVLAVRATSTGRVTAVIRSPLPGAQCGAGNAGVAAADSQTFFMTCSADQSKQAGLAAGPGKIDSIETLIYRFQVTSSGRITGYWLVRGGVLKGVWADNIAAAPDSSEVAAEVLRPGPSGQLYTNTIPEGIFVINTRTGGRALWHTGPYVPGAIQYAGGTNLSFTRDGSELVVLEARCHRGRYQDFCNGKSDNQVRAYRLSGAGGSLEGGQVLLQQSALKPPGTSLFQAFVSPDGSAVTAVLNICPRHGACTLSVARISVATGRVLRVLYQVRTGSAYQGVFDRFFSSDPSGRYLILDAGAGSRRVNGWIDHRRLVPLVPANGNAANYEAW